MRVTVEYAAQLKRTVGKDCESFDLNPAATLRDLVNTVAETHGSAVRDFLLLPDGSLSPTILLSVNNTQALWSDPPTLQDGDQVAILSPIAGG